jgi:hypothetical protein
MMEKFKLPLSLSEDENRAELAASEARVGAFGYPIGNRQQRRRQAMMERKLRRRERADAFHRETM